MMTSENGKTPKLHQDVKVKVWAALIEHRHGVDISICASEEIASSALDQWAWEQWPDEFPGEPRPDISEIQEVYFDKMSDRSFVESSFVDGPFEIAMEVWTPERSDSEREQ